MPCYRPLKAFRRASGEVKFSEAPGDLESLELPCGRCFGCRMSRASSWAIRCQHEAQIFCSNSFVTLTYSDDRAGARVPGREPGEPMLPEHGSLKYADVQKFLKRLRRRKRGIEPAANGKYPIRFFCAGEYGMESWRAHYHMLLFNFDFNDKWSWGEQTFRSPLLEELWPYGSCLLGSVTPASAAYVSRYSLKKVMGRQASEEFYSWTDEHTGELCKVTPEFCVMSRRPGIGVWWLSKYRSDVLPRDYVVLEGGKKVRVPRYYANQFADEEPFVFEDVQHARFKKVQEMPLSERSEERRLVCEQVAAARVDHLYGKRGF